MKQRKIHSTDVAVSSLGLGTVKFGRNQQVKYPTGFELPSDSEILSLLDLAEELGINFLDTAPAYGSSEARLGQLLGSRRDDWHIMSKAGEDFVGGKSVFDFSREGIIASAERTLSQLRTDRIESLLLHSDGNDLEVLEQTDSVDALNELKASGKILSTGISTKTVAGGLRAIELGLDAVMVTYNPWHTEEEPVLDAAHETNTSILLKKALGSGWLGDGTSSGDPVAESLRFAFSHPATTSAVIGTINPDHLRSNCAALASIEKV